MAFDDSVICTVNHCLTIIIQFVAASRNAGPPWIIDLLWPMVHYCPGISNFFSSGDVMLVDPIAYVFAIRIAKPLEEVPIFLRAGFLPSRRNVGFLSSRRHVGFSSSRRNVGFLSSRRNVGFSSSRRNVGFRHVVSLSLVLPRQLYAEHVLEFALLFKCA